MVDDIVVEINLCFKQCIGFDYDDKKIENINNEIVKILLEIKYCSEKFD